WWLSGELGCMYVRGLRARVREGNSQQGRGGGRARASRRLAMESISGSG
ncbi:hypothetical protein CFC21_052087, partial [Triticum aestivum]